LIQAPCPLRSPPHSVRGSPTPTKPDALGRIARRSNDGAPKLARQRAWPLLMIRTVTTGLTPVQRTREECGASAARRIGRNADVPMAQGESPGAPKANCATRVPHFAFERALES
jgi:hypothetical protein